MLMTINLNPELQDLIQRDVQRGPYESVDEFVERAVRMLHEQDVINHLKSSFSELRPE